MYEYLGGLLYVNMVLGSNVGFNNLTTQIKNLTTDVVQYRDEIINKIEVRSPALSHFTLKLY